MPAVTRADSVRPATPPFPTGGFSQVFSVYTLADTNGLCRLGISPCFGGAAVFGQLAGTIGPSGYAVALDLRVGPPTVPGTGVNLFGPVYGTASIGGASTYFTFGGATFGPAVLTSYPRTFAPAFAGGLGPETFALRTVGVEFNFYGPGFPPGAPQSITDAALVATVVPLATVPEPSTLALTLGGLAVLGAGARRRRTGLA